MVKKRKPYKVYTDEFKREALKLVDESDRSVSQIARQLGIRRNQIYKWREQMRKRDNPRPPKRGRPKKEAQSEISQLKQELRRVKEENEILKKAEVFFAKYHKSDTNS